MLQAELHEQWYYLETGHVFHRYAVFGKGLKTSLTFVFFDGQHGESVNNFVMCERCIQRNSHDVLQIKVINKEMQLMILEKDIHKQWKWYLLCMYACTKMYQYPDN